MSTLAEIEAAIAALPEPQVEELVARLNLRQAAARMANQEKEALGSVRDFIGRFASGQPQGAENGSIDADLAREAAAG